MEDKINLEFDDSKFCAGCLYIFKNVNLIETSKELNEVLKTEYTVVDIVTDHNRLCLFCFGILNKKNFNHIFQKILENIGCYEHEDFKLTTNFSPIFHILHSYWKVIFKKNKYFENSDNLDVSLIRKIIKPAIVPFLENEFALKNGKEIHNMKSDFEVKIIFDFDEIIYDKIYEIFAFTPIVKKIGKKKFRPDPTMDRGAVNELVKNCSSDLFYEIINKSKIFENFTSDDLKIKVELINSNLYLKGSYLKFSREIGQSPWEVNGVKICESSVEDEIKKKLLEIFKCSNCVMSAGGREDRDVRMLGSGRPFIIEIVNPKIRSEPLKNLKNVEDIINKATQLISIKNLDICDKNYYSVLKKYEDSKQKYYTCLVWSQKPVTEIDIKKINSISDMDIIQKTPMRVMHRRTLMDRKKVIYKLSAEKISDNFLVSLN